MACCPSRTSCPIPCHLRLATVRPRKNALFDGRILAGRQSEGRAACLLSPMRCFAAPSIGTPCVRVANLLGQFAHPMAAKCWQGCTPNRHLPTKSARKRCQTRCALAVSALGSVTTKPHSIPDCCAMRQGVRFHWQARPYPAHVRHFVGAVCPHANPELACCLPRW